MFRAFVIAVLCCGAFGSSFGPPKIGRIVGRIVGGQPASIRDYSFQVSVQSFGDHRCGGSILSASWILTAAHCTNGTSVSKLSVRAGTSTKESGGQVRNVAQYFQHPKFIHTSKTIDYDISVLRLAQRLRIGTGVEPVPMAPSTIVIPPGSLCYVSGWGKLSDAGKNPAQLQAVAVPAISQSDCKSIYRQYTINERMICAGYAEGGKNICHGKLDCHKSLSQTSSTSFLVR